MGEKRELSREEILALCGKAVKMRAFSYTPYSRYRVGAALLTGDGTIYTGCNIENASYTPTNCAERTAFFKAVSEGQRDFLAIAIAGGPEEGDLQYCPPCGVCRQVMSEFCEGDFQIFLARSDQDYQAFTLKEVLPLRFGAGNLSGKT